MVATKRPSKPKPIDFNDNDDDNDGNPELDTNNPGPLDDLIEPEDDFSVFRIRQKVIRLNNCRPEMIRRAEQRLRDSEIIVTERTGATATRPSQCALYGYTLYGPNCEDFPINDGCFATVGVVQEGSPAYLGGLRENDKFFQFGSINATNFKDISQLQEIAKNSIGEPIDLIIKRGEEKINITVVPQRWARRGLFGCQIMKQWCVTRTTK